MVFSGSAQIWAQSELCSEDDWDSVVKQGLSHTDSADTDRTLDLGKHQTRLFSHTSNCHLHLLSEICRSVQIYL